jgi:hypothetical protein
MRQAPRFRREERSRDGRVLGGDAVAVERGQREDLVALAEVTHVRRDLGDDAGEFIRRDRGQPVDRPRQLVAGERGGMDTDERLARPREMYVELLHDESLSVETDGSHPKYRRRSLHSPPSTAAIARPAPRPAPVTAAAR